MIVNAAFVSVVEHDSTLKEFDVITNFDFINNKMLITIVIISIV